MVIVVVKKTKHNSDLILTGNVDPQTGPDELDHERGRLNQILGLLNNLDQLGHQYLALGGKSAKSSEEHLDIAQEIKIITDQLKFGCSYELKTDPLSQPMENEIKAIESEIAKISPSGKTEKKKEQQTTNAQLAKFGKIDELAREVLAIQEEISEVAMANGWKGHTKAQGKKIMAQDKAREERLAKAQKKLDAEVKRLKFASFDEANEKKKALQKTVNELKINKLLVQMEKLEMQLAEFTEKEWGMKKGKKQGALIASIATLNGQISKIDQQLVGLGYAKALQQPTDAPKPIIDTLNTDVPKPVAPPNLDVVPPAASTGREEVIANYAKLLRAIEKHGVKRIEKKDGINEADAAKYREDFKKLMAETVNPFRKDENIEEGASAEITKIYSDVGRSLRYEQQNSRFMRFWNNPWSIAGRIALGAAATTITFVSGVGLMVAAVGLTGTILTAASAQGAVGRYMLVSSLFDFSKRTFSGTGEYSMPKQVFYFSNGKKLEKTAVEIIPASLYLGNDFEANADKYLVDYAQKMRSNNRTKRIVASLVAVLPLVGVALLHNPNVFGGKGAAAVHQDTTSTGAGDSVHQVPIPIDTSSHGAGQIIPPSTGGNAPQAVPSGSGAGAGHVSPDTAHQVGGQQVPGSGPNAATGQVTPSATDTVHNAAGQPAPATGSGTPTGGSGSVTPVPLTPAPPTNVPNGSGAAVQNSDVVFTVDPNGGSIWTSAAKFAKHAIPGFDNMTRAEQTQVIDSIKDLGVNNPSSVGLGPNDLIAIAAEKGSVGVVKGATFDFSNVKLSDLKGIRLILDKYGIKSFASGLGARPPANIAQAAARIATAKMG